MTSARSTLADTQQWLQSALLFPERVDASEAAQHLAPSAPLSALEHLAIYQRSYRVRLETCLREQFPVLCHALGCDLFNDFTREYLRACPPESYTLHDLGRRFADYLERERPDRAGGEGQQPWIDFIIDLARLERQLFVLFDAEGHEGEALAGPSTPDERLALGRGVVLGEYRFPVGAYHHDVRNGREPGEPLPERSWIALVRKDYTNQIIPIGGLPHAFLGFMRAGAGVREAMERAAGAFDLSVDEVERAWRGPGGTRERWIEAGMFVTKS